MQIGRIIRLYRLRYLGDEDNSLKKIRYTQRRIKIVNLGVFPKQVQRSADTVSEERNLQLCPRRRKMKQLFLNSQSLFQQSRKSTQLPFEYFNWGQ